MSLSLRTKIFSLVIASLALAVAPILWLTYDNLQKTGREFERAAFANTVLLIEDAISSRYLDWLSTEVTDVIRRKEDLRQVAGLAASTWVDVSNTGQSRRQALLANWTEPLSSTSVHLEIFSSRGEPLLGAPLLASLAYDTTLVDFKGRKFRPLLDAQKLPAEGEFVVLHVRTKLGPSESELSPILVYLMPIPETGNVVATAMMLVDIEQAARDSKEQIVRAMQEKLDAITLYRNGFVSLFSGDHTLLAHSGNAIGRQVALIPEKAMAAARQNSVVEYEIPPKSKEIQPGTIVLRLAYFKALDWYVAAAAPRSEIEGPVNQLIRHLTGVALVIAIISLLAALWLASRMIHPLRALTSKALTLPNIDFASPDAELKARKDLPLGQSDEVGQLAHAFASMGTSLAHNVRELMETTASTQRMQGELNAARDIQMGILPAVNRAPALPTYAAYAFLEPAKEVGGDLYDFFTAPDGRQAVILGDVSGKGVPAALFMSMTVTLVRYALSSGLPPAQAMTQINDRLSENNPGCMFVTLFIGLLDPETGQLEFANGGHCQPLVINAETGTVRLLEELSGPLVGAIEGIDYSPCLATLDPGETCLLYTDGVTEAMNMDKELFGEDRIREVMKQHRSATPGELVQVVYDAVLAYRGEAEPSDDITMLAFTRKKTADSGMPRS